jgi:hypothetical protein
MTLHISLPPETETRIRQRAAAAGLDPETYILNVLNRDSTPTNTAPPLNDPSEFLALPLDERLARVRAVTGTIRLDHPIDDSRESIYGDDGR